MRRRAEPLDEGKLDALHGKLRDLQVRLPENPSAADLRGLFTEIRDNRNKVARVTAYLLPYLGKLKADLVRIERILDAEGALLVDTKRGLLGTSNETERKARLKLVQEKDHEIAAALREELALIEEVMTHAKLVREELRLAYEEASRCLAALDFEWRVERGAP